MALLFRGGSEAPPLTPLKTTSPYFDAEAVPTVTTLLYVRGAR